MTTVAQSVYEVVMQPFEEPRYAQALIDLQTAFDVGYAEGKRLLAEGREERLPYVLSVFHVDVPRDHVLDGDWTQHVVRFEDAGRLAALAARRTGEARLDASQSHPDSREASLEGRLRWIVILNPTA